VKILILLFSTVLKRQFEMQVLTVYMPSDVGLYNRLILFLHVFSKASNANVADRRKSERQIAAPI